MAEQVPLFNDLMSDIDKVASGSYEEIKKGQMALARVSQQPNQRAELRKAIATLGDQLDLPLAQRSAGRGAAVQVKVNQVVAPQIAAYIDEGRSAEDAVRLFNQSEAGKSLGQIGSQYRSVLGDVFDEFTMSPTQPDFRPVEARGSFPERVPTDPGVSGIAAEDVVTRTDLARTQPGVSGFGETNVASTDMPEARGLAESRTTDIIERRPTLVPAEADEAARRVAPQKLREEAQKVSTEVKARDAERRFLSGETDDLAKGIGTGVQEAAEGSASKVKIGSAGKSLPQNIIDSRLGREVAETAGDLTLALGLSDVKTSPLIVAKSLAYSPAARVAGGTLSGVGLALDAYEIYKAMESLNKSAGVAKAGDLDSIVNEFEATKRITRGQRAPVIKPIGEQGGDFDVKIAADLFSQTPGVKAELISRGLLSPESARVVDEYITSTVMADPKKVENLIAEKVVNTRAAKPQESPFSAEEFPESPVAPDEPSVSAQPPAAEAPAAEAPAAQPAEAPEAEGFDDMKARMMNEATQRQAAARQPGILRVGSRGSAVGDLQTKLLSLDRSEAMIKDRFGGRSLFDLGTTGAEGIGIDNVYGTKTRDAVKAFQKKAGITADGVAGPDTMEALDKAIEATKLARQEQMRQNREIAAAADDAPATPAVPKTTEFTRVDESVFTDALTKDTDKVQGDIVEGLKTVDPTTSLMDTQEYLKLELDEEPRRRRSAFPMPPRSRRNRRNRQ